MRTIKYGHIYFDLDNTLLNTDKAIQDATGEDISKMTMAEKWDVMDTPGFFENIPLMPGALTMLALAFQNVPHVSILSSAGDRESAGRISAEKMLCIANKLEGHDFHSVVIVRGSKRKREYAKEGVIIVDDRLDTVNAFNNVMATGIHYQNPEQAFDALHAVIKGNMEVNHDNNYLNIECAH